MRPCDRDRGRVSGRMIAQGWRPRRSSSSQADQLSPGPSTPTSISTDGDWLFERQPNDRRTSGVIKLFPQTPTHDLLPQSSLSCIFSPNSHPLSFTPTLLHAPMGIPFFAALLPSRSKTRRPTDHFASDASSPPAPTRSRPTLVTLPSSNLSLKSTSTSTSTSTSSKRRRASAKEREQRIARLERIIREENVAANALERCLLGEETRGGSPRSHS